MNVLLLDLYGGGHHGQYVHDLVAYWQTHALPGRLDVVGSPAFWTRHDDVAARAAQTPSVGVHRTEAFSSDASLTTWDLRHGRTAWTWGQRLHADHVLFMYADHALLSLATVLRRGRTRYSGIHFRPTFHYDTLGGASPTPKERVSGARKALMLRAALANPRLHTLFELDPYAVPEARRLGRRPAAIVSLPEAFTAPTQGRRPAVLDAVAPDRKVAAFFGVLDERKGLDVVLKALPLLPSGAQQRLTLVLAGQMHADERAAYLARIAEVRAQTQVQVLLDERFLDEAEIQPLLEASDLVLMPYVRHVGSSGVLVRAAHAGRPVLTSAYGLVGAHARHHHLGLAVDTTRAQEVADALTRWLTAPATFPFDPAAAAAFAAANTSARFAATIFGRLLPLLQPEAP